MSNSQLIFAFSALFASFRQLAMNEYITVNQLVIKFRDLSRKLNRSGDLTEMYPEDDCTWIQDTDNIVAMFDRCKNCLVEVERNNVISSDLSTELNLFLDECAELMESIDYPAMC